MGTLTTEPAADGLILAAVSYPSDPLPWLALADWLEERGDLRGELLRLAQNLAATPARLRDDVPAELPPGTVCPWWDRKVQTGLRTAPNCTQVDCQRHRNPRGHWPRLPDLGEGLPRLEGEGPGPVPRRASRLLACVFMAGAVATPLEQSLWARCLLANCGVVGWRTRDRTPHLLCRWWSSDGVDWGTHRGLLACRTGNRNAHVLAADAVRMRTRYNLAPHAALIDEPAAVRGEAMVLSRLLDQAEGFRVKYPWGRVRELFSLSPLLP